MNKEIVEKSYSFGEEQLLKIPRWSVQWYKGVSYIHVYKSGARASKISYCTVNTMQLLSYFSVNVLRFWSLIYFDCRIEM